MTQQRRRGPATADDPILRCTRLAPAGKVASQLTPGPGLEILGVLAQTSANRIDALILAAVERWLDEYDDGVIKVVMPSRVRTASGPQRTVQLDPDIFHGHQDIRVPRA